MTASERMAGLVEAYEKAIRAVGGKGYPHKHAARTDLLAAIGELEQARDAQAERLTAFESCDRARQAAEEEAAALKAEVARATDNARMFARAADTEKGNAAGFRAEVARLAGVAREACDVVSTSNAMFLGWGGAANASRRISALRASIPTPDPAAFVAAVDEFGDACYELGDADHDDTRLASIRDRRYAARSTLLALGGVR